MNSRQIKKYNIPKFRFRELYYLCLQYDEYRIIIKDKILASGGPQDGMPKGTSVSDPVAAAAEAIEKYQEKVSKIEAALRLCCTDDSLRRAVKFSVTHKNVTFERLKVLGLLYYERDAFYLARRRFFYELDKLL